VRAVVPTAVLLAACGGPRPDDAAVAIEIVFDARLGDAPATCGAEAEGIGAAGTTVTLKDLRLYVHDVAVLLDDGGTAPLTLDVNPWQSDGVALLDFEDGSGPCAEFGTPETNQTLRGALPARVEPIGLAFTLGVPPALNHVDPLGLQPPQPPLDTPGLYWVWRTGYKYLRLELLNEAEAPDNGWFVHLGASGCVSDTPQTPPPEPCARPNLPRITLPGLDPATGTVRLDVGALVAGADVSTNTADTSPGCMMGPDEPAECDPVLEALGLDPGTGRCADGCAAQTFAVGI
jgi:uncharacterized repeat protein (TIGR04052 family)